MNKSQWIRKMLRRRGGPDDKMKRTLNICIYDTDRLKEILNIATLEDIKISHIVANLFDYLAENMDSPQKTIEEFALEAQLPALDASEQEWALWFRAHPNVSKDWQMVKDRLIILWCLLERCEAQKAGHRHSDRTPWEIESQLEDARKRQNEQGSSWLSVLESRLKGKKA